MTHSAPKLLLVSRFCFCVEFTEHFEDIDFACTAESTPKSNLLQSGHAFQEPLLLSSLIMVVHILPEIPPIITADVVPEALALFLI